MTAITGGTNVHNEHVSSGKENVHNGEASPGHGHPRGAGAAEFWAGLFKWDNRLKALVGLGIGGLVLVAGIFLVKSVIPAAVRQAVQPMFTALEPRFEALASDLRAVKEELAVVKEDVAELKRDMVELKRDMVEVKEDLGQVREDLGQVKEDVTELREGQAYIRGQVALLVRLVDPERLGVPE